MTRRYSSVPVPGSPPHGRGKAYIFPTFWGVERITPAWAGKSAESSGASGRERDHPRMGGEKGSLLVSMYHPGGSPPHGRGKDPWQGHREHLAGITPAWAGKRFQKSLARATEGDHPRVGGEKAMVCEMVRFVWGSPPRGRGKVEDDILQHVTTGITPAWAGKRAVDTVSRCERWDHPRVGGEKKKSRRCCTSIGGSPPRRRGKDAAAFGKYVDRRITPAWAGKRPRMGSALT